ncbi:Sodium channel protein type 4 subunit alpha A (Voltage-gated sodium channel subunit alpha Nav1.4a) [Durusdinium trenchii]|uniref:Sodium channel protein type 4 subunit alpha A (Voltage-gated sodium channel subunit alpha Nav1.4a) n=1 Tax=Durusdinium trenchii TaxID=1381693 RepID=A0ABP0QRM2_9DINO
MASNEFSLQMAVQQIQLQQKESMERMDVLKEQHKQWQAAVEDLLARVNSISLPQVSLKTERPEPPSGDLPEVRDSEWDEFAADSPKMSMDTRRSEDTSRELARTSNSKNKKLEISKGPLQKLVHEVMHDHHDPAHLVGMGCCLESRRALYKFVNSKWFEYVTGTIIMANMIMIGVETEASLYADEDLEWSGWVERAFLGVYTLELLLRFVAGGTKIFWNGWFLLDLFLVCVGILALVVAPVFGDALDGVQKVLVVRGLRLLRLARALRMVGHFKVIWRLVYGVLTAGHTILSVVCLMILWLFICGCCAIEFIRNDAHLLHHPLTRPIVMENFGSLPRSILTLLQFATADSIAQVYFPLIMERPGLVLFFMPILLIFSIALMNLVTAVLVEHALEHAAHEAESERLKTKQKIKAALPALLDIFQKLDTDESGCITREEIENVSLDMLPPKLLETVSVDSMSDLFDLLDVDGGGQLTQSEFVEGLLNLVLLDVPIWTLQSLKLLRLIRNVTTQIDEDLKSIKAAR